jgi:hypothetical protein
MVNNKSNIENVNKLQELDGKEFENKDITKVLENIQISGQLFLYPANKKDQILLAFQTY